MRNESSANDEDAQRLYDAGAAVVGATAAAGLSTVITPLAAAPAGAALEHSLKAIGADVHRRRMAPMQQQRIGEAYYVAIERIRERVGSGEYPREDDFVLPGPDGEPAAAEEVLEGVLL